MSKSGPGLPVDPGRLKAQFPSLTDDDLQAYVEVTRRILATAPEDRARITRETVILASNFSTVCTNFAEARACRPFSLTIFMTRTTAADVSSGLRSGALFISRQARGSRR